MEPEALEPEARAAQLPEEPNRFIGRERELSYLRDALRRTRALTLCGAGGIGKTRLALRLLATTAGDFHRVILGIATMSLFVVVLNRIFWRPLYYYAERKYRLT